MSFDVKMIKTRSMTTAVAFAVLILSDKMSPQFSSLSGCTFYKVGHVSNVISMSRASLRVKHQFRPVSTDLSNKLSVFGGLTSGGGGGGTADKDNDGSEGSDANANSNAAANSGVLLINCEYISAWF